MFSKLYFIVFTSLLTVVTCHLLHKRHIDFRERFLERRRQREIKDQRIKILDKFIIRNIESLDGIVHYRKTGNSSHAKWKKIREIEKDFRRLVAMDGMKYNYKRDHYWRTWRKIISASGTEQFVCYKCNNPILINATACQNCGMWTIEERPPPCPYEFFSVINDQNLCGANYTQYKDVKSACPSVIRLSDLTATCDNPIETVWRFTKLYGVPESSNNIVCGGKDFCEIFTSYDISPLHVVFRIINSSNDVMYSRIMKPNNTNYICVDDCGRFNPETRKVTKNDRPLKLDLLSPRVINKRDDELNAKMEKIHFRRMNAATLAIVKKKLSLSKNGGKKINFAKTKAKVKKRHQNNLEYKNNLGDQYLISLEGTSPKPTTISHCKKMAREEDHSSEEEYEEY